DTSVSPPMILHETSFVLAPFLRAARGESDSRGDKFAALSSTDLLVAAPIRDVKGRSVGAVVVSDNLAGIAARMGRGAGARIVIFSLDGTQRAANGGPLPFRTTTTKGLQLRVRVGGHTRETLSGPL